ncbi:DUF4430 domain-containing protein [Sporolactobacillus sp. THM19-2]|uniref:DUF4430 domain-containing protein n=1 Tax=Sporolactobacillus sp. THM19-2 TaxID=2511171 RepID=UPI0013ED976F|nr:DUF4430 domain-containing protein [Sporolactobacillus sp. THM19-2]
MKSFYRIIIYLIAALLLFGAGFLTGQKTAPKTVSDPPAEKSAVFISIDDGSDAGVQKGKITLSEDETVFTALQKFTEAKHIEMSSSGKGKMVYVTSLNHKKAAKNAGWLFTVNGKQPDVGAGAFTVHKNDRINWHYSHF